MVAEPELNCTDCCCYNCNVVECGRSLCSGKVNAAYGKLFHDFFSSRCDYIDSLVEIEKDNNPLPFLYVGDEDAPEEPEHDEF